MAVLMLTILQFEACAASTTLCANRGLARLAAAGLARASGSRSVACAARPRASPLSHVLCSRSSAPRLAASFKPNGAGRPRPVLDFTRPLCLPN